MKKLSASTPVTAFAIAFTLVAAACATGTTTADETDDVPLNEAGADESSTHVAPAADAASHEGSDGATSDAASDASAIPDASTTACGSGSVELGEYATWSGKVNVHRAAAGAWLVDDDCTSGADHNTVSYCQKYWPSTTRQVQLGAVTSDAKPFTSGNGVSPACGGVALDPGQKQFACCAP